MILSSKTLYNLDLKNSLSNLAGIQQNTEVLDWLINVDLLSAHILWATALLNRNKELIKYCKSRGVTPDLFIAPQRDKIGYRIPTDKNNVSFDWRKLPATDRVTNEIFICNISNLKFLLFLTNEKKSDHRMPSHLSENEHCRDFRSCVFCGARSRYMFANSFYNKNFKRYFSKKGRSYYANKSLEADQYVEYAVCRENVDVFNFGEQYMLLRYIVQKMVDIFDEKLLPELRDFITNVFISVFKHNNYVPCLDHSESMEKMRKEYRKKQNYVNIDIKNSSMSSMKRIIIERNLRLPKSGTGSGGEGRIVKKDYYDTIMLDIQDKKREWKMM